MFKPLYAFIAYRYLGSQRQNHFISFISLASVLGIALGVGVLIAVLSVMNGFNREIRLQMLSGTPHLTLGQIGGGLVDWSPLAKRIQNDPQILGAAPFISGQAMIMGAAKGQSQGVLIRGIDPTRFESVYPSLTKSIGTENALQTLCAGCYHILVGHTLAKNLGLIQGQKITLIIPEASLTPMGIVPRMKRFVVTGTFGIGELYDDKQVLIHLKDADRLFRMQGAVSGLQLRIADELKAPILAHQLYQNLNQDSAQDSSYWISDWTREFGNFFKALKLQKTVMTFILFLIIAVAAFNLVSSLVMVVTDKRKDIAILRTLGASRAFIMRVFMLQGLLIGLIGSVLGLLLGLFLATNLSEWVNRLQAFFDIELVSKEIYLIGFLPSEICWSDVAVVMLTALFMCFLATLYPAFRAANIMPAEALRYE